MEDMHASQHKDKTTVEQHVFMDNAVQDDVLSLDAETCKPQATVQSAVAVADIASASDVSTSKDAECETSQRGNF